MASYEAVVCPKCGATMNLHAEKLDRSEEPERMHGLESTLGGTLLTIHACPRCGWIESRRAIHESE